jgi:hypothetical protein
MRAEKEENHVMKLTAPRPVLMTLGALALTALPALASSHREAPAISKDPTADVTDVYAFRSPDLPDTVTLIANWIPLEQPQGGPNFYTFDDNVVYAINVDTDGDGVEDVAFEWQFRTQYQNLNTFLYNTGPITSLDDPDYNIRQYYTLTKVTRAIGRGRGDGRRARTDVLIDNAPVPPVNIGPRSTPNYDALASAAIVSLNGGGQAFAGQRDDPFFVDLGSIFDLAGLRPLNTFHLIPLDTAAGVDGVSGYNTHTTAIQVPIDSLGDINGVIGVYAAAYRSKVRQIMSDGNVKNFGPLKQVSRLGMPLTNEVLINLRDKDRWNATDPSEDSQFDHYILNPEPAVLENLLYPVLAEIETTNRVDLLAVFHTGIPGVNQLPQQTHADMLRLNLTIPPTAQPNRMGVLAGDLGGFPNGRRLADDIVDIELQAVACAYGAVGDLVFNLTGHCDPSLTNHFPNNAVGDGVDANEKAFLSTFPYLASPFQGYEAVPPQTMFP